MSRIFLALVMSTICAGCAMSARQTVRVGIGMTVDELRAGSTFDLSDKAPRSTEAKAPASQATSGGQWVVTEPFDLIYIYKGHELKKENIGGRNYLTAITTAPTSHRIVNFVQITFQNRVLELDEALAEAQMLNEWFLRAGFRPPSVDAPDAKQFGAPFEVIEQGRNATKYERPITTYAEARTALLDDHARIKSMALFSLATEDARVGVRIVNARQPDSAKGEPAHAGATATERNFYLYLSVGARPPERFWDSDR